MGLICFGLGSVTAFLPRSFFPPNGSAHHRFKAALLFLKMLGTGGPFWVAGAEVSSRPVTLARLLAA